MLAFGLITFDATRDALRATAQEAELDGFDMLCTGDHLRHPRNPDEPFLDGWEVLAAWAAWTERIRLGMLVSNLIYRNPVLLARQAVAVDRLSEGRLDLGIGTGVYGTDSAMAGVPEWPPAERVARLEEALIIVDRLLRGDLAPFEGRFYRHHGASLAPGPVQAPRPPLIVAANGPRAIAMAARYGDRWNTWGGPDIEDEDTFFRLTAERSRLFVKACDAAGRPGGVVPSLLVFPPLRPWASIDGFRALIDRYGALGFREFIFYKPRPEEHAVFRTAVEHVLPELRGAA